jgi:RNA polymerase sigma factor (sigma-70 family)
MTDDEQTNLMHRVARGDARAFRALAKFLGGAIFGLAYRTLNGNAAAAEDAVQDALIKWWTAAPTWTPHGRVQSYVLTIVYRCALDQARTQRVTVILDDQMPSSEPSTLDHMIRAEDHARLQAKIATLPARQRTALHLAYDENQSRADMAVALGTTVDGAQSLLRRAHQNLAAQNPERTV